MRLTRVSGSLVKPWSLAERELDDAFGDAATDGDDHTWSIAFRVYTLKVAANRSTGRVEITVSTALPYTPVALGSVLLVLLTALTGELTRAARVAFLICLPLCGIPLVPGLVHYQWLYRHLPKLLDADRIRISPMVAAPMAGFLFGVWLVAASPVFQLLALLLTAMIVALTGYAIGLVPNALRQQVPAVAFVFFSGFPLLLTAGNFGLLGATSKRFVADRFVLVVVLLGASTVVLLGIYSVLCNAFVTEFRDIPNRPITSRTARTVWFGYVSALNLLSILFLAALLTDYWWFGIAAAPAKFVATGFRAAGVPFPIIATTLSLVVLALPLVLVSGLWVSHVVGEVGRYWRLRDGTTPTNLDLSEFPVRIVESSQPVAYVAPRLPHDRAIVLSDTLRDELARDELEAVVAHEEYHIRNRDSLWNELGTVFGLFLGGRNTVVAAHDYPRVEREADHYAAQRHGAPTLVRALRAFERLQAVSPHPPNPRFSGRDRSTGPLWLLKAPYDVLFGSVILANAHATIDERAETILASADADNQSG